LDYLQETEGSKTGNKKGNIKKIWACGPPVMNFEFEDIFRRNRKPFMDLEEGYEIL